MKFRKTWAVITAAAIIATMSACSDNKPTTDNESTSASTTTASENAETSTTTTTSAAATTTTTATTTETEEESSPSESISDAESVKVYYGWGVYDDEQEYTAEIFCPEGAKFSHETLEIYAEEGSVMTATAEDEVNEYSAVSNSYWHPDAYSIDDPILSILQQLYFYGEVDAQTAEEYSGCSQKVTPLGFKWNGYDVILIETKYTFMDYGEQTDYFAGVEYDLKYWEVDDETYETKDLTTKGLFGFDIISYAWDDMTQDGYAWIAGQMFGVDSGIENPFAATEEAEELPADVDPSALLGKWVDFDSSWEDTYFFDLNSNGSYTSGFENTFTWSVEGNVLTVFYAEDDVDVFSAALDGDTLILVDKFGQEQRFVKVIEEAEPEDEPEEETESDTAEEGNPNAAAILGTWTESTTGLSETFTFNADGTGHYSCLSEDGTYECGFTYEFFRSDYIDIYYEDGDIGGFLIAIDGDELTVRNDYVWDLVYTRQ